MSQILVGTVANDGTGDPLRTAFQKINMNKTEWNNVMAYGAKGDGVTDDTAALQAAFSATPVGGTIYAPPGIYNFTGLAWNKAVDLVGEGNGTIFNYTPSTGTAFNITGISVAQANAGFTGTYGFYRFLLKGQGAAQATTGFRAESLWFEMEDIGCTTIGLGLTWPVGSPNVGFQNYRFCMFNSCGQLLSWPAVGAGEKIVFVGCVFNIATTFANGVQIANGAGGGLDMVFLGCSFDNTQFAVTAFGARIQLIGCHFEMVNINPAVPMIRQLDSDLTINGGFLLIPTTAVGQPQAISVVNTVADAWFFCTGLRAFTSVSCPFLTVGANINVSCEAAVQAFAIPAITGTTTGYINIAISVYGSTSTVTTVTGIADGQVALIPGITPAIDVSKGNYFTLTITTNIAVVIAVPTGRPFQGGQEITIAMRNGSGGVLTTPPTFNAGANGFKFSTVTNPANGTQVLYKFRWDPIQSFWYEIGTHLAAGI